MAVQTESWGGAHSLDLMPATTPTATSSLARALAHPDHSLLVNFAESAAAAVAVPVTRSPAVAQHEEQRKRSVSGVLVPPTSRHHSPRRSRASSRSSADTHHGSPDTLVASAPSTTSPAAALASMGATPPDAVATAVQAAEGDAPVIAQNVCLNCRTTTTPLWRKGPEGPGTLCNACGVKWRKMLKKAGRKGYGESSRTLSPPPPRAPRKTDADEDWTMPRGRKRKSGEEDGEEDVTGRLGSAFSTSVFDALVHAATGESDAPLSKSPKIEWDASPHGSPPMRSGVPPPKKIPPFRVIQSFPCSVLFSGSGFMAPATMDICTRGLRLHLDLAAGNSTEVTLGYRDIDHPRSTENRVGLQFDGPPGLAVDGVPLLTIEQTLITLVFPDEAQAGRATRLFYERHFGGVDAGNDSE